MAGDSSVSRTEVFGVPFDLVRDGEGKIRVALNGRQSRRHLIEQDGGYLVDGRGERVSLRAAIVRIVYPFTVPNYKGPPLPMKTRLFKPDKPVQLNLWQIEAAIDVARHLTQQGHVESRERRQPHGKKRVYLAEAGRHTHRAIELMLKVPLGAGPSAAWNLPKASHVHWLAVLYDQAEARLGRLVHDLETMFQATVAELGEVAYFDFGNPGTLALFDEATGRETGKVLTIQAGAITQPGTKTLRDHLVGLDQNSTYSQAYLGDAVVHISEAYLRFVADPEPLLRFVEHSLRDVILPFVRGRSDSDDT